MAARQDHMVIMLLCMTRAQSKMQLVLVMTSQRLMTMRSSLLLVLQLWTRSWGSCVDFDKPRREDQNSTNRGFEGLSTCCGQRACCSHSSNLLSLSCTRWSNAPWPLRQMYSLMTCLICVKTAICPALYMQWIQAYWNHAALLTIARAGSLTLLI